ncbi:MAG TPA: hypothetical protein VE713_18455 [Pyrinomonadaceae bacterium]|nr:hypothetical protein [Pyrinomonadaceae bacterium]
MRSTRRRRRLGSPATKAQQFGGSCRPWAEGGPGRDGASEHATEQLSG